MEKYQCQQCNHTEERSIGDQWKIQCIKCQTGTLTSESDERQSYAICQVCSATHDAKTRQCPNDGNVYLTYYDSTEPLTNKAIIKEIKHCRANDITQHFECTACHRSTDIFRSTAESLFCSCGELIMVKPKSIKDYREGKRYSQQLMSEILAISLRHYRRIETGKALPSTKLQATMNQIMGT